MHALFDVWLPTPGNAWSPIKQPAPPAPFPSPTPPTPPPPPPFPHLLQAQAPQGVQVCQARPLVQHLLHALVQRGAAQPQRHRLGHLPEREECRTGCVDAEDARVPIRSSAVCCGTGGILLRWHGMRSVWPGAVWILMGVDLEL